MNEVKSTGCASNHLLGNYCMANKTIFCNVPWTNLHIYWDGSYGMCCSEKQRPHTDNTKYNIATLKIEDWYNSLPARQFRQQILSNDPIPACDACYSEEAAGYESRRIKENFKSVLFRILKQVSIILMV